MKFKFLPSFLPSFLLTIGIVIALSGCGQMITGIPGSGIIKTESREIRSFDAIEFAGAATLMISIGDETSLTITGDDNLLEFVDTEVDNQVLKIAFSQSIAPSKSMQFVITTPDLDRLKIAGACKATVADLSSDSFELAASGAVNVTCSGVTEAMKVAISGAGSVDGRQLVAKTANVNISGSGSVDLHAVDELTVKISGAGQVRYIGEPKITKNISGMGSIKPIK